MKFLNLIMLSFGLIITLVSAFTVIYLHEYVALFGVITGVYFIYQFYINLKK